MKYKKTVLKNGATLICAPLKETKAITVLVMLKVGSRFEEKEVNGISHFVEHLMFKGTKKRPSTLVISHELDSIGANFNAFTAKDHTGYYIKAAAEHLPLAIDMLSDQIFNSKFEVKEVERERGVIIEEINMYNDDPRSFVAEKFEVLLYGDTPLGRFISGPKEVIQKVGRGDIVSYWQRFYQPENMVITIAGNFDEKKAELLVKKYFSQKPSARCVSDYHQNIDQQKKPQVFVPNKKTEQAHFVLGVRAYPYAEKEKVLALKLLSVILGGGMSSRLFINIRERQGLCYYIYTDCDTYEDTGSFAIFAGLDQSRIELALRAIVGELSKVKKNGVTAAELKKAKEQIKGRLVLTLEDSENIAAWLGRQQLLENEITTPDEKIKQLEKITTAQIKQVATELFKTEKLNLALIGPFADKDRFLKLLKI